MPLLVYRKMSSHQKRELDQLENENVKCIPAPTTPIAKIELCATSVSWSCDNLLKVSMILSLGFEADSNASAKGTERLMTGSPY